MIYGFDSRFLNSVGINLGERYIKSVFIKYALSVILLNKRLGSLAFSESGNLDLALFAVKCLVVRFCKRIRVN